jgi:hypothetical protein
LFHVFQSPLLLCSLISALRRREQFAYSEWQNPAQIIRIFDLMTLLLTTATILRTTPALSLSLTHTLQVILRHMLANSAHGSAVLTNMSGEELLSVQGSCREMLLVVGCFEILVSGLHQPRISSAFVSTSID